jgi:hypothetical protein
MATQPLRQISNLDSCEHRKSAFPSGSNLLSRHNLFAFHHGIELIHLQVSCRGCALAFEEDAAADPLPDEIIEWKGMVRNKLDFPVSTSG